MIKTIAYIHINLWKIDTKPSPPNTGQQGKSTEKANVRVLDEGLHENEVRIYYFTYGALYFGVPFTFVPLLLLSHLHRIRCWTVLWVVYVFIRRLIKSNCHLSKNNRECVVSFGFLSLSLPLSTLLSLSSHLIDGIQKSNPQFHCRACSARYRMFECSNERHLSK